jgi:hypothetical protein
MAKKKYDRNNPNPNCPVSGCQTDQPHAQDPIVKALIIQFAPREKMTEWVLAAMAELRNSIVRDLQDGQVFAWFTRFRQPEELYIRTLYCLFVANEKELHHVLSGEQPNGISGLYEKVNPVVFEGRGLLLTPQPGLDPSTTFKPMDMLHEGAHISFSSFLTVIGLIKNPTQRPQPERIFQHLTTYCNYLNYMHGMFKAGKEMKHVLAGVINMHRPAAQKPRQTGTA